MEVCFFFPHIHTHIFNHKKLIRGAGTMAQQFNLSVGTLASHIRVPLSVPALNILIQLLANASAKAACDGPSTWNQVENLDGISDS